MLARTLNKLCKWRTVLASWQLGTRGEADGECQAVKDHREVTLLLRVEASALAKLLLDKEVITKAEWEQQLLDEALALDQLLEQRFPGFKTSDLGVEIDPHLATETTRNWPW